MADTGAKDARVRLFTALDLPGDVRGRIAAWGARELCDAALRPVPAESLHVTLCFLGWVESDRAQEARAIVEAAEPEPVRIRLSPAPAARPAARPRLFVLEAESRAAIELQARQSSALAEAGLYEPADRPWWPHLTVARVRSEAGKRRSRRVVSAPGELPEQLTQPFDAVRVSLYRSYLRSDGAQYVSLANLNLPPSAHEPGRGRR